ncbi:MAG: bifunctional folylpolyglutamate synthase/dihydrofolate synthase [Candidatus Omnitrophica bacterium]|nr:bifunctional folylpolyglutamate synthase/dihydrofolate synthase [Candidatus Omnitrophota bacterium]
MSLKKSYTKALRFLDGFINYEKKSKFSYLESFSLLRVNRLFSFLKVNHRGLKIIHLAGTKGKGSTANFVARILAGSGYKVGLYTSPHITDLRERIRIIKPQPSVSRLKLSDRLISKNDFSRILETFENKIKKLKPADLRRKASFFEVYTALALKYFSLKKVDFLVLETGLGGRLDATNVVNPKIVIITNIDYDHTDLLGNTLSLIAKEKAAIIKEKTKVIISQQAKSVDLVLKREAKKKKSELYRLNKDFFVDNLKLGKRGISFDFKSKNVYIPKISLPVFGRYQADNAALAISAVSFLPGVCLGPDKLKSSLKDFILPGRFEIVKLTPLTVLDIAHNPYSFTVLNRTIKEVFPDKKVIIVFAAAGDKNISKMIRSIEYDELILTKFNHPRVYDPYQFRKDLDLNSEIIDDPAAALKKAFSLYKPNKVIVVCGSSFLVSCLRRFLKRAK